MVETRRRFIEAFDGIRFAQPENPEHGHRIVQAELELFLSLLYGDRLILPENQSFDSSAFLHIADRVLAARPPVGQLNRSPVAFPFELAWRKNDTDRRYTSFREMTAFHLRQTHKQFILSAWPGLSEQHDKRVKLAEFIADGDFDTARAENVDHHASLDQLERVDRYFRQTIPANAGVPNRSLDEFIGTLRDFCASDPKARESGVLQIVPEQIDELRAFGISFKNRTDFKARGKSRVPEAQGILIEEFIDSAYNRVISSSLGSKANNFSTSGSAANEQVVLAELLAEQAAQKLAATPGRSWNVDFVILRDPHARQPDPPGQVPGWATSPNLWRSFWELVVRQDWIDSVTKLQGEHANPVGFVQHFHEHRRLIDDALRPLRAERGTEHPDALGSGLGTQLRIALRGAAAYISTDVVTDQVMQDLPLVAKAAVAGVSAVGPSVISSGIQLYRSRGINRSIGSLVYIP